LRKAGSRRNTAVAEKLVDVADVGEKLVGVAIVGCGTRWRRLQGKMEA
jgi:hypothetical protein